MITLTINATDPADLRVKLRDMLGVASEPPVSVLTDPDVAEVVKTKRKAAAPRVMETSYPVPDAEPMHPEPVAAAPEEVTPADIVEALTAAPEIDYLTVVKPAVLAYIAANGRQSINPILADFGITNAQQLDPSRYADFLDALK
jgi:hypothetical protein